MLALQIQKMHCLLLELNQSNVKCQTLFLSHYSSSALRPVPRHWSVTVVWLVTELSRVVTSHDKNMTEGADITAGRGQMDTMDTMDIGYMG